VGSADCDLYAVVSSDVRPISIPSAALATRVGPINCTVDP